MKRLLNAVNKVISILCIGFMLMTPTIVSAAESIENYKKYNSIEEAQADMNLPEKFIVKGKFKSTSGYEVWKIENTRTLQKRAFLGYHPAFTYWDECDGYWVSSDIGYSLSVSIGGKVISVGVGLSSKTNGRFYAANSSKESKLGVYGDKVNKTYRVTKYNGAGIKIGTYTTVRPGVENIRYKAVYRS